MNERSHHLTFRLRTILGTLPGAPRGYGAEVSRVSSAGTGLPVSVRRNAAMS
jgi:hypothetical protein